MFWSASILTLSLFVASATAQVSEYGQCGGIGYTGSTACASGLACVVQNAYYSQCLPGTASTTSVATTSKTTVSSTTSRTTTSGTTSASSPASTCLTVDTTSHCGQWDNITAGPYSLLLDQWGSGGASSGSDCASLTSLCGSTIAWKNTWSWTGGTGVKSFTDIMLNQGLNKQLSAIKSIPSTWNWAQTSTGTVVADVAYDLFTSATPGGSNAYEIMIWLANYNAGPISYTYGADGSPTPVASNLSLGGHTWNLYYGSNGANYVYSFLPTSGTITSFSADLNAFLQYLSTSQTLSSSQYLTTVQAGTEATSGSASLTVSAYSAVVN